MVENEYSLNPTDKSPEILGNIQLGEFHIKGICIPENSRELFTPFKEWLMEFVKTDAEKIKVNVDLEYFNTSTSSILLDIFRLLEKMNPVKPVEIKWFHDEDDLDMEEAGEDYRMMVGDILTVHPKKFEI